MKKRNLVKASMTVEAVFVMFPILFAVFWIMKTTILFYQQTRVLEERIWLEVELEEMADEFRSNYFKNE